MDDINKIVESQRHYFSQSETKDIDFRIEKLKLLRNSIINNENKIISALKKDLNKAPFEAYETELGIVLSELNFCIKHLPIWIRYKRVRTLMPLIGSIAAGNCTILKPSSYSPNTSEVIGKLMEETFDESYISVVIGGRKANQSLLEQKFDYIFFTGSPRIGKIVMKAASKHLTPVTLELGGKSPCIVDETADINLAAKRIVWGKLINLGQTCIAPDYLMVHNHIKEKLIDKLKYYIIQFYGLDPFTNTEYPKIINESHFRRLLNLLDGQNIIYGGQSNEKTNQIAPTILDNVSMDDEVMKEEIFGPILPILTFEDLNGLIELVNSRPKPLALYLFSKDKITQKKIIKNISFGGACINDTIVHVGTPYMPFGGVGESGMGAYHGKASFDTFSHEKSIVKKSNLFDITLRYPPYNDKLRILKKIMK